VLFGLGWPQWLTIIALIGGLLLTFWVMAKASVHYEKARQSREQREAGTDRDVGNGKDER
jgi:CHASE1-domain containing sensor protein